ncbi:fasciclin domain-containing protein [Sphingobacterium tabacisoli]|uniref:Fasciclin domain-containing protein n=1 Tax=Sphingobacterium tabacisoli TaxID=2044855 RepID=A0ABW5L6J9_9SPHI|nr:fasciclin domain-containing protein [Sphingobacterium tabacisoli]
MHLRFTNTKAIFQLLVWLLVLSFSGCKYDDLTIAVPNENIRPAADFIKNNYDTRLFYAALRKTGLDIEINGEGPFTVLVPNDLAFNEIGVFRDADFDQMNLDSLRRVIAYHILPRRLYLQDVPTNSADVRYATLEGSELYASLGGMAQGAVVPSNKLCFSGAEASRMDVPLANGVLHIVDKVMKPQFELSIQDWLTKEPQYSVFVEGLKKFGLWDQFAEKGPFTVFAPTNKALEEAGITSLRLQEMVADNYLGDVLFGVYIMYQKHVFISDSDVFQIISGKGTLTYKLKDGQHVMSFGASKAYPTWLMTYNLRLTESDYIFAPQVGQASYEVRAKTDYLCSNGVVHDLDKAMVKPNQALKK